MEVQVQRSTGAGKQALLLVFVHGNGLTASTFRRCIAELFALNSTGDELHCLSIDLPGHGRNERAGEMLEDFTKISDFAPHVVNTVQAYCNSGEKPKFARKILVAHSIGCHVSLFAHKTLKFDHAVLIEPILVPAELYASASETSGLPKSFLDSVRNRRSTFPSLQSAMDALRPRGIYASWETECVRDFVFHGGMRAITAKDGNGQEVALSCLPQLEHHIFLLNISEVESELEQLRFKSSAVVMVGSKSKHLPHVFFEYTANKLQAKYVVVEGADHVIMCEMPKVVAAEVYNQVRAARDAKL